MVVRRVVPPKSSKHIHNQASTANPERRSHHEKANAALPGYLGHGLEVASYGKRDSLWFPAGCDVIDSKLRPQARDRSKPTLRRDTENIMNARANPRRLTSNRAVVLFAHLPPAIVS